jgi:outer membrane protein TolC
MTACGWRPRWTPETVAPPASLTEALEEAQKAAEEGVASLPGDQGATQTITRDGAILTALARNRSLAVQRFAPEIAATREREARAAFDPSLLSTVSYGRQKRPGGAPSGSATVSRTLDAKAQISEFLPTGTEVFLSGGFMRNRVDETPWNNTGTWSAGINQSLLRGAGCNVNLVTLRQARNTAARSLHELRGFVMDLVLEVEKAYWELALARETLGIRQLSVQLAYEQLQLNLDLISVQKLAGAARYSAEAELATRQADLVDAEAAVRARTIDLIRLLDPDQAAQWAIRFALKDAPEAGQVDIDQEVSARLAPLYKPELAQARLDLANRDLEVVRTRNGLLPRLDVSASYGRLSSGDSMRDAGRHLDDSDFDNYDVGASLEFSPLNRAERARHRRALFEQQAAEASIRNLEQLLESEVRRAAIEVERQWQRIPATQQAVKYRLEELETERSRFAVGKSTNLDVLQVHRNLIQAKLDEVTARVRFIEALANLYHAEGTLLERRGVATVVPETTP